MANDELEDKDFHIRGGLVASRYRIQAYLAPSGCQW